MSVALFVQSANPSEGLNQTLILPDSTIYHRTSTGKRGQAERWLLASLSELPDTLTTTEPVAVRLTTADISAIPLGKVTNIAVKALNAHKEAKAGSHVHSELVADLSARLDSKDRTLGKYITDPRFTDPSTIFDSAPTQVINIPIAPTPTISTPVIAPSASLVMEIASVPDKKWSDTYIQRRLIGNITEFDVFDKALESNQNVLIKGHAGSGKTMSVLAYASARNMRYGSVSATGSSSVDHLLGRFVPDPITQHFTWIDGIVTQLVRNGGVLLLNEVNFLPERITTAIFSLLDDRREIQLMDKDGEVIKAHPDLLVIADMNPNYRGTRPMNQAWADRFSVNLEFPYDDSIEKRLIPNKVLLEIAKSLRDRFDKEELSTPISTRSLVAFTRNMDSFGLDFALYSYLNTFTNETEKASVKMVFDTYRDNLESKTTLEVVSEAI